MRILYKIATKAYVILVSAVAPFNGKAEKWSRGRKHQKKILEDISNQEPLIWFHCASLGEFEQGKPVIDGFKAQHPEWKILVTFFSPSGYDVRKNYNKADYVFYLPIESKKNINVFLSRFNPKIVVFVKYEFWYDYIEELHNRSIPLIFISSTFRKNQLFFQVYGKWFLKQLNKIEMFFVQDKESQNLLIQNGINTVKVSGDTRFDRVRKTARDNEDLTFMESFKGTDRVLIFGSAWETETKFFLRFVENIPENWKVIFAPHEINKNQLSRLESKLNVESVRFSNMDSSSIESKILFVDTIGHLARMYRYSDIAFIGGGYNDGIHNILEPLVFGVPAFFGPNHHGFGEGKESIEYGVGYQISNYEEFEKEIKKLIVNPNSLAKLQKKSDVFIQNREGATNIVLNYLNEKVK